MAPCETADVDESHSRNSLPQIDSTVRRS